MVYTLSMLKIHTIEVTPFMQNARILACSSTQEAVIVDPGGDVKKIWKVVQDNTYKPVAIWLTHSHLDHAGGVAGIKRIASLPMYAHPNEAFMRSSICTVAGMYGVPEGIFEDCPEPEELIQGGETVSVGQSSFKTLFTPGHSPGHISFYNAQEKLVIAGDVLFAGSIGRTDLPGGDYETLINSVRKQLFALPGDTKVLPGHGPDTTISEEIRSNPFFTGQGAL
jgi:hydroxyacylglutathione hydrolase